MYLHGKMALFFGAMLECFFFVGGGGGVENLLDFEKMLTFGFRVVVVMDR